MSDVAVVDRKSESREAGGGDKRSSSPFPVSPSPFSITEIHNIAVECATYLLYSSFLLLSFPVFFLFLFLRFFSLSLSWSRIIMEGRMTRFDSILDDESRIDRKGFFIYLTQ